MKNLLLLSALSLSLAAQAQVQLVKDILPGNVSGGPENFNIINGKLLFAANDGTGQFNKELWTTDGTEAGTHILTDLNPGGNGLLSGMQTFAPCKGKLLFSGIAPGKDNCELWSTDGTAAGTVLLKDLNPNDGSFPFMLTPWQQKVFFTAEVDDQKFRLCVSDGTAAGTHEVMDTDPGNPATTVAIPLLGADDKFFFISRSNNFSTPVQLWATDGTKQNTEKIAEFKNVSERNDYFAFPNVALGNKIYFSAEDSTHGVEPWVSDGTAAGTFMLKDIADNTGNNLYDGPLRFLVFNNTVYFITTKGLYITDGTVAGTQLVVSVPTNNFFEDIKSINKRLILFGSQNIWSCKGTIGHMELLMINASIHGEVPSINANGLLYFAAREKGTLIQNLWATNGSAGSLYKVTDLQQKGQIAFKQRNFIQHGNDVYLTANIDPTLGYELYKLPIPALSINDSKPAEKRPITIYPNPANNTLNIDLPQAGKHHVSVMSITGQVLLQQDVVDAHNTLNISTIPAGTYLLQVSGNGNAINQQFIKQ